MAALPLPVALPAQPNDPLAPLPPAPVFPPTVSNVLESVKYRRDVEVSIRGRPADVFHCCSPTAALPLPVALPAQPNDPLVSLPPAPVFPPTVSNVLEAVTMWKSASSYRTSCSCSCPQAAALHWAHQLRLDIRNDFRNNNRAIILPDLKRLVNEGREDGNIVPFEVVPFMDGTDPTEHPHDLPVLHSVNDIENLNGQDLVTYLTGYGVVPPVGGNPDATNRLRKEALKRLIGASM